MYKNEVRICVEFIMFQKMKKIITYDEINGKKLKFKQIRKNRSET